MPTRDDLIADWHKRLAEASDVSSDSSSRPAWLTRLRIRLYRFLLSLYERGDWNAPEETEEKTTSNSTTSTLTADLPLSGKPAKSTDVIRHALSSISGTQAPLLKPGTLAGDLLEDGWIVVGSSSAHIRTDRLVRSLRNAGIASRISQRGDDRLVEVHGRDRNRAFALIPENQTALHGRDEHGQFEGLNFLVGLVTITVLYAPLAGLFVVWPLLTEFNPAGGPGGAARCIFGVYFLGWAACIMLYCGYGAWHRMRRS